MTNTAPLAERSAALDLVIIKHCSWGGAIGCILDYLDDPAAISSPSLIAALDILNGDDPEFADITKTHELINEFAPEFARELADAADLCHDHSCDPDICRDDH